jgi:energy-coupling factor transport system ATP-binding protein
VPGVPGVAHPRDLSEGQRLALALAIVLTSDPPVLLLDEPTRGLDYPGKRALAEVLRGLAARGKTVLVSTHDVEWVAQVADRVVVLADGEVVSAGPVREVIAQSPAYAPQVTKVLGLPWLRPDEVRLA